MKLRGDPEKKSKDYSMPCEKQSNESVYDVRTRATNQVRQADQGQKLYGDNLY